MKIYQYDHLDKSFIAEKEAEFNTNNEMILPVFHTILPPPIVEDKQVAVFDEYEIKWNIHPDHRGEIWYDKNKNSILVQFIGDPKDNNLFREV